MKYSFGPESLIARVEIVRTESGAKRAYLESAAGADKTKLAEVREALAKHGYLTVPIEVGGKPLLEVRKFSNQESLLKQLGEVGGVSGTPAQQMGVQDRVGVWQWLKNNTFKACLSMYAIGDAAYMYYTRDKQLLKKGKLAKYKIDEAKEFELRAAPEHKAGAFAEFSDQVSSYGYMAGTVSSGISTYLRGDQSDEEVYKITKSIDEKLNAEAIKERSAVYHAISDEGHRGIGGRLKDAFIKFPAEILNSCYGMAGLFMVIFNLKSEIPQAKSDVAFLSKEVQEAAKALEASPSSARLAYKHGLLDQKLKSTVGALKVHRQDVLLGSITLGAGLISTLVKEKPKHPDEQEPDGVFAKAWRWLEEKPLRIAAVGYLASTAIHLVSTLKDYSRISGDKVFAETMVKSTDQTIKSLGEAKLHIAAKEAKITHGRMVFVVTNLIAEVLMGLSSKGHGEGVKSDATVETSATAIAAENIALQTPEKREELVEKFAQHMASPKVMGGSSVMIARGIRANLKSLESNPWADSVKTGHAERVVAQAAAHDAHSAPAIS